MRRSFAIRMAIAIHAAGRCGPRFRPFLRNSIRHGRSCTFNLDDLRLPDSVLREYVERRHTFAWRQRDKYVRPLPWNWIATAAQLPGAALRVALLLGWQAGRQRRSRNLTIPTEALRTFRIGRRAYYHTLRTLEAARLVTVARQPGRKARVTIVVLPTG